MFERWKEFRRSQRAALRESNRPHADSEAAAPEAGAPGVGAHEAGAPGAGAPGAGAAMHVGDQERSERLEHDLLTDTLPPTEGATATGAGAPDTARFGQLGRPLNRQSPFFVGFVGAIGVLVAIGLWETLGRLTTTFTLLVVAFFLTLALNPLVESLTRRGVKRPGAVTIVFAGVLVVFTLLGLLVVPPVIDQGAQLAEETPGYLEEVLNSSLVRDIDKNYQVVDKIQEEFNKRITDSTFISSVFGGVLGAGKAVLTGLFQIFTVLILTLFLLGSLPRVKQAAYQMVPASRRVRVVSLSEEIMKRTGSYAIGQVAVATVNAALSWLMMIIVGIPYAAVLAVLVGFLGLVPMVGATLGAVLVCTVAVFDEPKKAVIALVYYVVYQQVENYIVVPRIMQRTVSVPGAVTVVAALAGGTLLGLLGALLAIPVAAGLLLLYEEVLLPRQRRH